MSNYVVVPDSYKGCLSSVHVCEAIAEGIRNIESDADIVCVPMSDGGEGMLDAVVTITGAEVVNCSSFDPLMRRIEVAYAVKDKVAMIESARVCGMGLLKHEELNPIAATTYGLGVVIADALKRGCSRMIVGLGGSATCDAGVGMIKALTDNLSNKGHFDEKIRAELKDISFTILADVVNPLLGAEGAAHVFAPQKGASPSDVEHLEWRIKKFSEMSARHFGFDYSDKPSAGAAGGLGYAFMQYLGAEVCSGADYLLTLNDFDEKVKHADAIFTGEGRADSQTLMGKLPYKVLKRSSDVPVHLIAGSVNGRDELIKAGFKSVISVSPSSASFEENMHPDNASRNISKAVTSCLERLKEE